MSNELDPTEGLCSLCSTISVPYEEPNGQNQLSHGLRSEARVVNRQQPVWEFKHGTVSYVLRSARRGCSFCFLLAPGLLSPPGLDLGILNAVDEKTQWLLLRDEVVLPARIIDVGTERDEDLRLYVPRSATRGKYAVLSYCWGQSNLFVTTSANFELLQHGFPVKSLPRTLRDAVGLTRGLGLRYLWVDAFCIIQGDDDVARADWALQVKSMEHVYAHALATISAAGGSNSNCGLYSHGKCLLHRSGGGYLSVSPNNMEEFVHEPINRRAWTMQEHLLSPRLLICTSYGLIWQCNEALIGKGTTDVRFPPTFKYRLPDPPSVPLWTSIVENFCVRDLTNPADKFHAIAALARRYHAVTNDGYVAGLWKSKLREHLLWVQQPHWGRKPRAISGSTRPERYRAPTWSWASIDSPVRYIYSDIHFFWDTAGKWLAEARCHVELVDAGNPFGAVKAARLVLTGPSWKPGYTGITRSCI
ncbi:hypothetical protein VMCG_03609 [Cytospora schulzeri]|uniref:Heterokaryon incompatibility domain-containing protein n=1 Tax=Cytospora schulzeri TaxID=448051 RepID=A0A423WWQ1_9PEZI|nr:hypothetical protein VMCG_03609 [Valsa malicola]